MYMYTNTNNTVTHPVLCSGDLKYFLSSSTLLDRNWRLSNDTYEVDQHEKIKM